MSGMFSREIPVDFHGTEITERDLPWFETPHDQRNRWRSKEEGRRLKKRVAALLPRLTERQEVAFRLWLMGHSYRAIANIMNTNVKTAWEYLWGRKGRHGGAIRRLRKCLGIEAPDKEACS